MLKKNKKTAVSSKEKSKKKKQKSSRVETAESMARAQREISISEFFTKNRHLLGFDNPRKALLTTIKEAVDNSLDACEDAAILPDVSISIEQIREDRYRVRIRDNGPGILKSQVPKIFAKLLYGSKFHSLKQSRGQQGIGISAAAMYGQLTTGKPVEITTKVKRAKHAYKCKLQIDTRKNHPDLINEEETDWEWGASGTMVAIEMAAAYQKGQRSVDDYLKQTVVANPHVTLRYKPPGADEIVYERVTRELPVRTTSIKPHPHGVELGLLMKMLKDTSARSLSGFLKEEFSRVGAKVTKEIIERAKLSPKAYPKRIARQEADALHHAISKTRISSPSADCIAPIGQDLIISGLRKEVEAEFYTAVTRQPAVYRGHPFLVEVGVAYGKPGAKLEMAEGGRIVKKKNNAATNGRVELLGNSDAPIRLLRFANRVPLQYQQSACAVTKSVISTNWKSYGLQQSRGAIPSGPMVLLVHIASVWVPFTSESKEAIAPYPEILKEVKLALFECGRHLSKHIRKGRRMADEFKKRSYIELYLPHIGIGMQEILGFSDRKKEKMVQDLQGILERSRKF